MSNFSNLCASKGLDEPDITPVEYARLNGLSRNHLIDLSSSIILGQIQESINTGIINDSRLEQLRFPEDCHIYERLTVSKDGAQLLAWALHLESRDFIEDIMPSMQSRSEFKVMRVDLPLLRSDHETDIREFARREALEPKLKDVRLPLENLNIARNEGLEFSPYFWNLGKEIVEDIKTERIIITRESLEYMQRSIRPDWTGMDEKEFWKGMRTYAKKAILEPVTPPLSPRFQGIEPYEPSLSDPVFQVPILSDPASLTCLDLSTIEKGVFREDIPSPLRNSFIHNDAPADLCEGDDLASIPSFYCDIESASRPMSPSVVEGQQLKQLISKIEGPLTPPMPILAPKSVHFSDFVEDMLLNSSSTSTPDAMRNIHFERIFGNAAKTVNQRIEQETLLAADTMGRVEEPVLDFSLPEPPWKNVRHLDGSTSSFTIHKEMIKEALGDKPPSWPGQKSGHVKLKWNPFPQDLAKMVLKEVHPEDDCVWKLLLKSPGDDQIVDTSTLTWKPPGMRILRDDDDDEEIEVADFQEKGSQDIVHLAKKRRVNLDRARSSLGGEYSANPPELILYRSPDVRAPPSERETMPTLDGSIPVSYDQESDQINLGESGLLMGDVFSAQNALDNFFALRGVKKQKTTSISHFTKASNQTQVRDRIAQSGTQNQKTAQPPPESNAPVNPVVSLPVPTIPFPTAPISVIISSDLLKDRALIKGIESQLPALKLIERDFKAHNTTAWLPNSVTRSPVSSPLDSEADLIVSPTTGIILTTLQKIKQKALPGQKSKPPIRNQLEKVSIRYEKLVVLVSDGRADNCTHEMDEIDCRAFGDFVGFTAGLDAAVQVQFVGGGKDNLFKWLANCIMQHAAADSSLLEEETHWELFLRRAGMNAFAAQCISSAMKIPREVESQEPNISCQSGLAAFVQIGRQQRINRFGEMCGKSLMERVSTCLDARWG